MQPLVDQRPNWITDNERRLNKHVLVVSTVVASELAIIHNYSINCRLLAGTLSLLTGCHTVYFPRTCSSVHMAGVGQLLQISKIYQ